MIQSALGGRPGEARTGDLIGRPRPPFESCEGVSQLRCTWGTSDPGRLRASKGSSFVSQGGERLDSPGERPSLQATANLPHTKVEHRRILEMVQERGCCVTPFRSRRETP